MYRSPNESINISNDSNHYSIGKNNISKRFSNALDILLSTEYYEGSELGQIYNETGNDGRSKIYVEQKELENRFINEFLTPRRDFNKFLIGYTGVGKTTLIRNIFHVFSRDVSVFDNNLIIYISFYAMMADSNEHNREKIIDNTIYGAIQEAITYLDGRDFLDRINSYDDNFYKELYDYLYQNNKHLAHDYPTDPESISKIKGKNKYLTLLQYLFNEKRTDYELLQLKFYLNKFMSNSNKNIKNIIFIFDDIEVLSYIYHKIIIEKAQHIKKCMQAYATRPYNIKTLVSLRNYAFRNSSRVISAQRNVPTSNIILKDQVPKLKRVLEKRIEYVLTHNKIVELAKQKETYMNAYHTLVYILDDLYGQYDDMIMALTHNNLFYSMNLLMRILTNKKFIGKYEIERNGAFKLNKNDYKFSNPSGDSTLPGSDSVFYALAYGEGDGYRDEKDYYLTNIMHYKNKSGKETELLGIYIIQYMLNKQLCMGDKFYDGLSSRASIDIFKDIFNLYDFTTEKDERNFKEGLLEMIKHLYEGGALLQSISEPLLDPEIEDGDDGDRVFDPRMKLYLSSRGAQLYKMLSFNSLLLEIYRDDIDTELDDNDKLTQKMPKNSVLSYCLKYIEYLFNKEKKILEFVKDKSVYLDTIGKEIATVVLLQGIRQSLNVYFIDFTKKETLDLYSQYNELSKRVNKFIENYNENERYKFSQIMTLEINE